VARNGLQYEDIEIGTGRRVFPGDAVLCYYVGTYNKGLGQTVTFDETQPGEPAEFVVGKGMVIPGWDLGICGSIDYEIPPMKIGGDRKLVVPSSLAYGESGAGPIPANQDLTFQIFVVNAQPTGGVDAEVKVKGIAALIGVVSTIAVIALFVAQNIDQWI
jgi:FKBP-type peptidyl-prolyl cis-trans isomerase